MTWPIDKLTLINQQLTLTGNNIVAVAEDGSQEWDVCSAAYEQAFEYALDSHDWKQITTVRALVSTGVTPADSTFDTAYVRPSDAVHIVWVRVDRGLGFNVPINYRVLSNQIVVNLFGNPGTTPPPTSPRPQVTAKFVSSAGDPQDQMLRTFMTALGRFVMAGIYRGLHKDRTAAAGEEQAAMQMLQQARTRSDQEEPKRAAFNFRITAVRRTRKPWPPNPRSWGGTGAPS